MGRRLRQLFIASLLVLDGVQGATAELPLSLRKAEQWYHTGRLSEARSSALSYHDAFPKDIEGLLVLAKIDLESENLVDAKKWLRLADVIDRHHPLVIIYRRLLEDLEHRQGPITQMPEPLPTSDRRLVQAQLVLEPAHASLSQSTGSPS